MTRESLRKHYARIMKAFEFTPDREIYQSSKMIIDLLNQTEWIPVTKKLPEYGKEVLTCSNGGFIEIQSLENSCNDGYWENQKGDWSDFDEVIAWMPLPESYEGGE